MELSQDPECVRGDAGVAAGTGPEERRRRERRYRLLYEHVVERFAIVDADGTVLERGGAPRRPAVPRVGDQLLEWVAPPDRPLVAGTLAEVAARPGRSSSVEAEVLDSPGARRWAEMLLTNLIEEESVGGIAVGIWDITVRHLADQSLNVDARLLDSVSHPVMAFDRERRVLYANRVIPTAAGWTMAETIGRTLDELGLYDGAEARAAIDAALSGEEWNGELTVTVQGRPVDFRSKLAPVRGPDGAVVAVIATSTDVTAAKASRSVAQRLTAILDATAEAIVSVGPTCVITGWNAGAERAFGYPESEAIGEPLAMLARRGGSEVVDRLTRAVRDREEVDRLEAVWQRRDGAAVHVRCGVVPLPDAGGALVLIRDVTDQVEAQASRDLAEHRFLAAFRGSNFGMYLADLQGRVTAVNPALCQLLDRPANEIVGHWLDDFTAGEIVEERFDHAGGEGSVPDERRYLRPDGTTVWLEQSLTLVRGGDGHPSHQMAQLHDVSERRRMEDLLTRRTLYDELTGLASRTLLTDRLNHALAVARWGDTRTGVVFIALDGFKHVNDAYGQVVGDQLLVAVSQRLAGVTAPIDTLARFGGDEYAMVSPDATPETMRRLASEVSDTLSRPFHVGVHEVRVGASLGISLSRTSSTSEVLLSEAGAAVHRAKELGRGRAVVFDDSLTARAAGLLSGERALRAALDRGEIHAWYQPIVDLASGRILSAEALARWVDGSGRVVLPAEFVPLAERTGLIADVGRALLRQATDAAARWNAGRSEPVAVSVNLSARQLADDEVVADVATALAASGLEPALLQLEITETSVIEDLNRTLAILERLRGLGVRLAIDDFGTGYSSLSYLKRLPVDTVKIDRSFVSDIGASSDDRSIVGAIIALSGALGLRCLAEGVEDLEQRDALSDLGCELGQGYFWSAAVPEADLVALLDPRRPPRPPC